MCKLPLSTYVMDDIETNSVVKWVVPVNDL